MVAFSGQIGYTKGIHSIRQRLKGDFLMSQAPKKKLHLPRSKGGKIVFNLVITLIVGVVYFYLTLPAINLQSSDFYVFVACSVWSIS